MAYYFLRFSINRTNEYKQQNVYNDRLEQVYDTSLQMSHEKSYHQLYKRTLILKMIWEYTTHQINSYVLSSVKQ